MIHHSELARCPRVKNEEHLGWPAFFLGLLYPNAGRGDEKIRKKREEV